MFSKRTGWALGSNALEQVTAQRRSEGHPLFDLTESNPTRVGLGFPQEVLREALRQADSGTYDPHPFGAPSAREAIARYYAGCGCAVPPEQVLVTASTSEAYAWLFKLLGDPGDEVLVPTPSYPLFELLAGLESMRAVPYPLRYDGEWHVDFAALDAARSECTRAVIAVSPNNPTGSYLKAAEHAALSTRCEAWDAALMCDEVFADYPLSRPPEAVRAAARETGALTFTLSGLSKVAALPQLKVGWLAATGPRPLVEKAMARLELIADSYLSASGPSQLAVPRVLEERAAVQQGIVSRLQVNLETIRAAAGSDAAWQTLKVEGGWSAVLRVPRTRSELEWARALAEREGVLVHPGYFYDFPAEGYLVVSLLPEPAVFREGVGRMARLLAES